MKLQKKPSYILTRFENRWELWEEAKGAWTMRHPTDTEIIQGNGVIVLPTHLVHALHILLHSTNSADFEKLLPFQIEAKGFVAAPSSFAYDTLSQKDGKSLLLVAALEANRCDPKIFKKGNFSEIFPKIFPLQPNAITLWKEDSLYNLAVTKNSRLVYFQSLMADVLGEQLCHEIRLISWQLHSMNLFPEQYRIFIWSNAPADNAKVQEMATILNCPVEWQKKPSPSLPDSFLNLTPSYVQQERKKIEQHVWLKWAEISAAAIYLLIIGFLNLYSFFLFWNIRKMEAEKKLFQPKVEMIQSAMAMWKNLGLAVDVQRSPLNILVQINQSLPSEGVRLLQFNSDDSSWSLEGEAQNITQATSLIEQIKKNSSFKNYQWDTPQPQIFNNMIRFKIKALFHEIATIK